MSSSKFRSNSRKKNNDANRIPGKALKSTSTPGVEDASLDASTSQTARNKTVFLKTARGRTTAQQRWLNRQLNDPYVAAARKQGWRSRAAFKLIEIDDRFKIIKPESRIIDLGAAPGGWSQVAIKRGAAHIAGVDLLPIDPVHGADFIEGDFTDPDMPDRLKTILGGPADLVMSDMAPNTTGHAATDHLRIMGLAEGALDFAMHVLADGGTFIAKVFQGGTEHQMLNTMKHAFQSVKHVKPPASRKESKELYVIATGFRPDNLKN
ncbi:RlmE family RNA methyltransferase [Swingsia samuiensis]|uniref:Ribosomal RNA large subunit methyltransferase E n=1 Tax=Swingsia samuiensis TaxID=1293412 RepID=A0A4Y6UN39_9PROT|nr:RlmE family RNA methyltransferase [Swingsia samuiensis]QDH17806.1 RlmE family RNA methyltransferase [Swingsia samuiensis]